MRIITGSAKSIKLKAPRGMDTRPTTDRVKESMFNILGAKVLDARVLDLFAGTGNLGLEALSRGANSAIFIDYGNESINVIKDNAQRTKLIEKTAIYKNDVLRSIDKLSKSGKLFELIFCDPPYNKGFVEAVLLKIDAYKMLAENGLVVIEHSRHEVIPELINLQIKRSEKYGETMVSFLGYKCLENTQP